MPRMKINTYSSQRPDFEYPLYRKYLQLLHLFSLVKNLQIFDYFSSDM